MKVVVVGRSVLWATSRSCREVVIVGAVREGILQGGLDGDMRRCLLCVRHRYECSVETSNLAAMFDRGDYILRAHIVDERRWRGEET